MAYTNIWDDTKPTGSEPANTIDDLMRSMKVDIEQRFNDMFAMPSFATDPLRLYGLKFTDAQDAVINLGDNGGTPRNLVVKNKAGSTTFITIGANLALTTTSGITPLSVIGITAFSRFSRNEAAFGGALIQFDRSGIVAGYIGMDSSDNLTIQRGADAANTITINRSNGAIATSASSADALTVSVTGAVLCSNFKQLTASTDFVSRWTFQNGVFWDMRGIASDGSLNFIYNGGGTANLKLLNSGTVTIPQGLTISANGASITGGVAIQTGGLSVVAGDALFAAGIKQTGTVVTRFENTVVTRPAGSTGSGVEIGAGIIQSYNATGAAYTTLLIQSTLTTFAQGGVIVPSIKTTGASGVATVNNTLVTIVSFAGAAKGIYMFSVTADTLGGAANCMTVIGVDGSGNMIKFGEFTANANTGISISGTNIQYKQNSGGSLNVTWTYTLLA